MGIWRTRINTMDRIINSVRIERRNRLPRYRTTFVFLSVISWHAPQEKKQAKGSPHRGSPSPSGPRPLPAVPFRGGKQSGGALPAGPAVLLAHCGHPGLVGGFIRIGRNEVVLQGLILEAEIAHTTGGVLAFKDVQLGDLRC